MIGHAPDSAVLVIGNEQRAIGTHRQSRGAVISPARLFDGARETVREDDIIARRLAT